MLLKHNGAETGAARDWHKWVLKLALLHWHCGYGRNLDQDEDEAAKMESASKQVAAAREKAKELGAKL